MHKLLFIFVISIFVLTACDTTAENTTPAAALELEQSYLALLANGSVSFNYPDGWFLGAEFPELGIRLGTSNVLVNTPFDGIVGDDIFVDIIFIRETSLEQDTPQAVLQSLIDDVEEPEGAVSEIETITLDGKEAAFITLDADDNDGIQIVIDSGSVYSLVLAAVDDGKIEDNMATVQAIAGSINYIIDVPAESTDEATAEITMGAEMTPEATADLEMTAEATEAAE